MLHANAALGVVGCMLALRPAPGNETRAGGANSLLTGPVSPCHRDLGMRRGGHGRWTMRHMLLQAAWALRPGGRLFQTRRPFSLRHPPRTDWSCFWENTSVLSQGCQLCPGPPGRVAGGGGRGAQTLACPTRWGEKSFENIQQSHGSVLKSRPDLAISRPVIPCCCLPFQIGWHSSVTLETCL